MCAIAGALQLFTGRAGIELLEEVVAFVIDEDEGWEIFYADFPDGFHAKLWIFQNFDFFDRLKRQLGSDSAN